jgi:hypothetical protein
VSSPTLVSSSVSSFLCHVSNNQGNTDLNKF